MLDMFIPLNFWPNFILNWGLLLIISLKAMCLKMLLVWLYAKNQFFFSIGTMYSLGGPVENVIFR